MTLQVFPRAINENQLWETVLDEQSGKPRLAAARSYFLPFNAEKLPLLVEAFDYWQKFNEALLLKDENLVSGEIDYFGVKCSKRGNDVYSERIEKRLGFLKRIENKAFFKVTDFEKNKAVTTKLLWVTLTYDSKRGSCDDAWDGKGKCLNCSRVDFWSHFDSRKEIKNGKPKYFKECWCGSRKIKRISGALYDINLWITNLRHKYGRIDYVKFSQPFPNKGAAQGYPHHHLVMSFKDYEFNVVPSWEKNDEGKEELVYRINERWEFKDAGQWHSPIIDVKALQSPRAAYNYVMKYAKDVVIGNSDKATINNAVLWLYKKKSFTVSGDFAKEYSKLLDTDNLRNSKDFQADLQGNPVAEHKITCLGVFPYSDFPEVDQKAWFFVVNKACVDGLMERYKSAS